MLVICSVDSEIITFFLLKQINIGKGQFYAMKSYHKHEQYKSGKCIEQHGAPIEGIFFRYKIICHFLHTCTVRLT